MTDPIEYRFGVEEEFSIVDADGNLVNRVYDVLNAAKKVSKSVNPDSVKSDLHECMVEISTGICTSVDRAADDLKQLRRIVGDAAAFLGLRLLPTSVHPTAPMSDGKLVETDRYLRLIAGGALRGDGVHNGMHFHIEIPDKGERITVVNRLRYYIPEIIAISVNSPFYLGRYNGVKSVRFQYYEPVTSVGPPPVLEKWEDLDGVIAKLAHSGVRELRDIYSDIRLRERFPTIEIRCFDVQHTVESTTALAAFVRSLVRYQHRRLESPFVPPMTENELETNRRAAYTYGLEAKFALNGKRIPSPERIEATVFDLLDDDPVEENYLSRLLEYVRSNKTGADRQLTYINEDGLNAPALINDLSRAFYEDVS
jgi:carboxylate-amine ligase